MSPSFGIVNGLRSCIAGKEEEIFGIDIRKM
jgi:hypothetical protein